MKTTYCNSENVNADKIFHVNSIGVCEKIGRQLQQAKEDVLTEFRDRFKANQELLRLAVAEADALAWQTEYPHLLFPVLAMEKILNAADWQARQKILLRHATDYALAA